MTAALSVVPSVDDEELDQLEHAVEIGLTAAVASLTRLRELDAHRQRGYDLWHRYVLARFGDLLRLLRLPDGERLALVESMSTPTAERPRGLPVREQAQALGVAVGSVQNDKRALGLAPAPRPRLEPQPAPAGKVYEQAAEYLRRHPAGLTRLELASKAGWSEGKAGGALADTVRVGLGARADVWRDGQRVFMLARSATGG